MIGIVGSIRFMALGNFGLGIGKLGKFMVLGFGLWKDWGFGCRLGFGLQLVGFG